MPSGGGGGKRRPRRRSAKPSQRSAKPGKLPADGIVEVLYLRANAPEGKREKDVAERFGEIDALFDDDLGEEAEAPVQRRSDAQELPSAPRPAGNRPTGFSGVTFVEMLVPCRRASCKKCAGTNGSSRKPVAISRPLDEVGADLETPGIPDDVPSTPVPGQPAGPRPSAADAPRPLAPSRPAAADREPAASTPVPPVPAADGSDPLFWSTAPPTKAATRPVSPPQESHEPERRPVEKVHEIPKPQEAPSRPTSSTARPQAAGQDPAPTPSPPPGIGIGPRVAGWPSSDRTQTMDILQWRALAELDGDGLEFRSSTGAWGERLGATAGRYGPTDAEGGAKADEPAVSRLERILQRAVRLGFRRVNAPSTDTERRSQNAGERQPYQGRRT